MLSRDEQTQFLRQRLRQIEAPSPAAAPISSGISALDALLPARGFRQGTLIEWLGSGATTLALFAARQACRAGPGALVVIDPQRRFFPPAAAGLGIDLSRLMVVCPATLTDASWAWNQALRCSAIAAVLGWPARLGSREFRRWQLAAEAGGALGLLVRPASAARSPSWADVRLHAQPLPAPGHRRWRVETLYCRGAESGRAVEIEIDEEGSFRETRSLPVVSALAAAAPAARSARA